MKKIILIVALVVAYGVSMSNAATKIVNTEKAEVTLVANDVSPDGEEKATVENDGDCAKKCSKTAKAECSKSAKAECSKTAKKEGCSSACSKTAAKSGCSKEKQQASK